MVSLILLGRKYFTLDKAKTALDAVFLTPLRWWFQLRLSSKWTPTNLKDSFLHPVPTLSISLLSIWSLSEVILTSSFLFLKRIYLVLDAFKVSLFALNQSSILERLFMWKILSFSRFKSIQFSTGSRCTFEFPSQDNLSLPSLYCT